jgi:hypothetical protein
MLQLGHGFWSFASGGAVRGFDLGEFGADLVEQRVAGIAGEALERGGVHQSWIFFPLSRCVVISRRSNSR